MNILTFNFEYPPLGGGGGVVHELIAEELAKRHRIVVITSAFGDLPRNEVRSGVELIRVPILGRKERSASTLLSLLSYPPAAWRAARRLLATERFDLVHGHFAVPTGVASVAVAKQADLPHVISLHGGDIYDPTKSLSPHRLPGVRSVVSWVMRESAVVVAQSRNTSENARRYYGYDGPIELLPLGIRKPSFAAASRSDLGLPEDRFLAVTVGRLVPRKGIDRLLEAIAETDEVDLLIVGDGPERTGLIERSRDLGLGDRVRFLGHVTDERKWQVLAASDAYVSATVHEGFGLVYLEAMSVGLPIVTFDYGGQVDFLEDDRNGYLVSAGDVGGLTEALTRLQSSPDTVARMREQNLLEAPSHQIETCAKNYEALFEELVTRGRVMPSSAFPAVESDASGSDS